MYNGEAESIITTLTEMGYRLHAVFGGMRSEKRLPMKLLGIFALLGIIIHTEGINVTTLKNRISTVQHEADFSQCFKTTVDTLKWANFIIIEDASKHSLEYEELNDFNYNRHKHFTVSAEPTYNDFLHIFDQLDTRKPINLIIICSELCLRTFLTVANGYDDYNNQQGYFSWANKYLLVSTSAKPSESAANIDNLHNVLLFRGERSFGVETFVLRTAIGQNVNPRFVQVGTCRKQRIFNSSELFPNLAFGLNRQHFKISTNIWEPFVGRSIENSTVGYHGLCMDLLQAVSDVLNFTYELSEPEDGQWGVLDNGKWTGLVGDLAYKRVDMVIAPLSQSIIREEVVTFLSQPFYVETIQAVYKNPGERDKSWQLFLPFKVEVWSLICVSIAICSVVFYLLDNVILASLINEQLRRSFSDYVLMAFGSSLSQGSDDLPKWNSGRIFWSLWWFFCIIILCTYSGNLIAFLAVSLPNKPFSTFEELLENREFTYGILGGTSHIDDFNQSRNKLFSGMWRRMKKFNKSDPDVFSIDNNVHIEKIYKEKYVYILDKTAAEFLAAKDCSIVVLPDHLGKNLFYSLALRKNSAYQQLMSDVMIKIGSTGLLQAWKMRNWPLLSVCEEEKIGTGTAARVKDLYGAFILLIIMIAISVTLLISEIVYKYVQCIPYSINYVLCKFCIKSDTRHQNG